MPSGIYPGKRWSKGKTKKDFPQLAHGGFKKGNIPWNKGKRTGLIPKSAFKKGCKFSEEFRKKMGESQKGEKCNFWKGGISFEPYSVDWTKTLKRSIRERDRYTCQICGKEPAIIVHHIDYDKKNCDPKNLIILCRICHGKTNTNRNYWTNYFQEKKC